MTNNNNNDVLCSDRGWGGSSAVQHVGAGSAGRQESLRVETLTTRSLSHRVHATCAEGSCRGGKLRCTKLLNASDSFINAKS